MSKDTEAGTNLPDNPEELNARLSDRNDAELSELLQSWNSEFDAIHDDSDNLDEEKLVRLATLAKQITAAEAITVSRQTEKADRAARAAALRDSIRPADEPKADTPAADATGKDAADEAQPATAEAEVAEAPSGELISASTSEAIVAAMKAMTDVGDSMKSFAADYLKPDTDLNQRVRLGTIAQYAPNANVPVERSEAVITASADVPGFTQGGRIENMEQLGKAMHSRARALPVSRSGDPQPHLVASLQREFTFTLNENTTPKQMNEVLTAASDEDILVAAGGWCAPSEISYDFFNIVCEDGMIDLPTVGLNRGGVQYPTSPSFGDLAGIDDIVWTWTEQDDIDAVDSASVFKPCVRVECPTFIDRRADCDGFCVTAGNLVDYAYPELIANWLRLVMAIRAKATNARIIDLMLNGGGSGDAITPSIPVDHTGLLGATTSALLTSIELSIVDYREKFSMCWDSILEVVLPRWANMVIRADLANRDGIDVFSVTDGQIADWFNLRRARVQFVGDWQVRDEDLPGGADPLEALPTQIQYMVYAPGTFVRGNGMSLDLGVVRDSVLNATNDHTAAWAEDCYALLKPGHESRVVTVDLCASGEIGARTFTCDDNG